MKNVEQFDSTAEFIAAGLHYSNGADFDRRLEFAASAGMNQSTPAEGGFLTAPRVTTEAVITKAEETSLLLARVLKLPMGSSNRAAFPVVDESSRANGSRWGGIVLGWTDEGVAIVESKPKFRQSAHIASRLSGVIYMTNELRATVADPPSNCLPARDSASLWRIASSTVAVSVDRWAFCTATQPSRSHRLPGRHQPR